MRITRLVAHPVCQLVEGGVKVLAGTEILDGVGQCRAHAGEPRIAFGFTNGKAQMSLAQAWMALAHEQDWLDGEISPLTIRAA